MELIISTIGRSKVLRKFLKPMCEKALEFCAHFQKTVVDTIVVPSIKDTFGGYPDLCAEMTKILVSDNKCSLWERQGALATAEVNGFLSSLAKFFDAKEVWAKEWNSQSARYPHFVQHFMKEGSGDNAAQEKAAHLAFYHYVSLVMRADAIKWYAAPLQRIIAPPVVFSPAL